MCRQRVRGNLNRVGQKTVDPETYDQRDVAAMLPDRDHLKRQRARGTRKCGGENRPRDPKMGTSTAQTGIPRTRRARNWPSRDRDHSRSALPEASQISSKWNRDRRRTRSTDPLFRGRVRGRTKYLPTRAFAFGPIFERGSDRYDMPDTGQQTSESRPQSGLARQQR